MSETDAPPPAPAAGRTPGTPASADSGKANARRQRESAALRANLTRRKAAQRARRDEPAPSSEAED